MHVYTGNKHADIGNRLKVGEKQRVRETERARVALAIREGLPTNE